MKSLRTRLGQARALLGRAEIFESRARSAEEASTSGRTFEESCVRAERLQSSHHPSNKFPWGIFAAGGSVCTGLGFTLGHYGNQLPLPDLRLPQLGWSYLAEPVSGLSDQLGGQSAASRGHNFLADAAAKAMPAVVNIRHNALFKQAVASQEDSSDKTCGSGFLIDKSGIVLTNAHVVESALERFSQGRQGQHGPPLKVMLQDGQAFDGEVLSLDRVADLAMIKITSKGPLPVVKLGSSRGMRVGEWVLALGSPLSLQNSVTAGIVSCTGRKATELGLHGRAVQYIQTDAAINNGNSGGPLVNLAGEVVGISCMRALFSSGVSFAIPIDHVQDIVEQMKAQGKVARPYIGIRMLQLTSENVAQMREKDPQFPASTRGILVATVHAGSPAAKAGLRQGDIITGFGDGKAGDSVASLVEELKRHVGKTMGIKVQRGRKGLHITLKVLEDRVNLSEL